MKAIFDHIEELTPTMFSLFFSTESKFNFIPGQYVEVSFPDEDSNNIENNRWFTLSSSPNEDLIAITIKVNPPLSVFKNSFISLKKGQEILISQPIGDFMLPINEDVHLVFISGGIGVTPVRSIIKWLIEQKEKRSIQLIYIAKDESSIIFDDVFKDYSMNYQKIFTTNKRPNSKEFIDELVNYNPGAMFFISGPQTMVESIANDLIERVGNINVIIDYFPGYDTY
jgi:ferredoxin-NADP reductase